MVGGLLPCSGCQRHVRRAERHCPFCGVALASGEPRLAELRLLTPLDRSRWVALGAVLSAAGIALGCREPAVAVYGAPPPSPPEAVSASPSVEPPATQPSAVGTPSAVVEPPAPSPSVGPAPTANPAPTAKPAPTQDRRPDPRLAPAYGAPPRQVLPELDRTK